MSCGLKMGRGIVGQGDDETVVWCVKDSSSRLACFDFKKKDYCKTIV